MPDFNAYLLPLSRSENLRKGFGTFDSETLDGLKGSVFYCGHTFFNNQKRAFYNASDFFTELVSKKVVWFAHNLDFDARFLVEEAFARKLTYSKIGSSKILQMSFYNALGKSVLTLRDSAQFLLATQEDAAKSFKVEQQKLLVDDLFLYMEKEQALTELELERLSLHCSADVVQLHQILTKFRQLVNEIFGIDCLRDVSLAASAMRCYRHTLKQRILNPFFKLENNRLVRKSEEVDDFIRKAYAGGRVEVFKKRVGAVACYDVNSLYPSEMFKHLYPTGAFSQRKEGTFSSDDFREILLHKEGFAEIEFEQQMSIPILWIHDLENRLIFANGNLSGIYPFPEIRYAIAKGVKITRIKRFVYFQHSEPIFKEYIDKLMKLKLDAEAKGNSALRTIAKILMNSLYGKFGQRKVYENSQPHIVNSVAEWQYVRDNNIAFKEVDDRIIYFTSESSEYRKIFQMPYLAAYVTSYARITLHRAMSANSDALCYCDTDSVYLDAPAKGIEIHNSKLGAWKLEGSFDAALFLAPKVYACAYSELIVATLRIQHLKVRVKGLRGLSKIDFPDFAEFERVLTEGFDTIRYANLQESLKRTGKCLSTKNMRKKLTLENHKRKYVTDILSEPFQQSTTILSQTLNNAEQV